ncbi:MAG: hypothetical protein ACRC5G_00210 [Cetobacterium sp.]
MANGKMNFDQFEGDEMNYIPREFLRGGEEKRKVPKMKKENKEKSKGRIVNERKRFNEFTIDFEEN